MLQTLFVSKKLGMGNRNVSEMTALALLLGNVKRQQHQIFTNVDHLGYGICMAIPVVEFQVQGYKIRKSFA